MAEKWEVRFPTFEGSVNFVATADYWNLLHINPRPNEMQIVFNSERRGTWATEERIPYPQCMADVGLVLQVVSTDNAYDIYHNGVKIHSFRYRHNPADSYVNSITMTKGETNVSCRKIE